MKNKSIINDLELRLVDIARDIISRGEIYPEYKKTSFYEKPDDLAEHEPKWHSYGIITHSIRCREVYDKEIKDYLEEWGMKEHIDGYLSERIDRITKDDLLRTAMLLHDIGKFSKRTTVLGKNGAINSFKTHPQDGARLVSNNLREDFRERYGLGNSQIDYISKCIKNHFVLGNIRDYANKNGEGFSLKYVNSDRFVNDAKKIIKNEPGFGVEIGLLFLADSLSKVNHYIKGTSDEELDAQIPQIKKWIAGTGLCTEAIRQTAVNIAATKRYLELVLK